MLYITLLYAISIRTSFSPDLLCAVGKTSYGIRVGFLESTHSLRYLFMYLFVFEPFVFQFVIQKFEDQDI